MNSTLGVETVCCQSVCCQNRFASRLIAKPCTNWRARGNYDYISPLFTTSVGTKMLMATGVMQLLGIWMISKIVAIKV